ncbi:MAG: hypothetical protein WB624_17305, partial [Xanthobacteraceae bacterium]
ARRRKGVGERLAHADGLTSLSGKNERNCHCFTVKAAKDTAISALSSSAGKPPSKTPGKKSLIAL